MIIQMNYNTLCLSAVNSIANWSKLKIRWKIFPQTVWLQFYEIKVGMRNRFSADLNIIYKKQLPKNLLFYYY